MSAQNITITINLPKDVYERASETASQEQRSLEDMLSGLINEGLNVHASLRELFEAVSVQYRARLDKQGRLAESPDTVLQELRQVREQIAHDLYPG